jgi:hypothetical protein
MRRQHQKNQLLFGLLACLGLAGCSDKGAVIAECRMEASGLFGLHRKPHPISGALWQTHQEIEYVSDCMRAKGYKLISACKELSSGTNDAPNSMPLLRNCYEGAFEKHLPAALRE